MSDPRADPMADPPSLPPLRLRLPEREDHREILDGEGVSRTELTRSLRAMASVNRYLGGVRGLLPPLLEVGRALDRPLRLLDVGTGGGGLPRILSERLKAHGIELAWTGIDLRREVLAVARQESMARARPSRLVQGDGIQLPFRQAAFDVVTSSLTLHHLTDDQAPGFLAELSRVAGSRVLISDLERHPLHYVGARLLSLTLWRRDAITRIDGPLSVLRSFTPTELRTLAEAGPLHSFRIRRTFPFRLLLDGVPS